MKKKATYNEFIEVLNIFTERDAELYILDENIMYFVGRNWKSTLDEDEHEEAKGEGLPSPNLDYLECGLVLAGDYNEKNTNLNSFINNLKTQFSQNEIIYSAYVIFVLIVSISVFLKSKKLP